MPEHIRYEDDDLFNPETQHESSDVPVRPLFISVVIFVVVGVLSHIALWLLYNAFVKSERARMDPPQTGVSRPADAAVPKNQPLLQPFPKGEVLPQRNTPVTDLEDMRAADQKALHTYGWVDKEKGVVRIPIGNAKELMVTRAAAPAPAAATTTTTTTTTTGEQP